MRKPYVKKRSILVADDDRMTVQLISARLRKAGYDVIPAYDAMQAHMFAQREVPAAVLIDVNMPGGGGLDALRKIRASAKTGAVPIIAISIADDPKLPERSVEAGAEAFLKKPVDLDALESLLGDILGEGA